MIEAKITVRHESGKVRDAIIGWFIEWTSEEDIWDPALPAFDTKVEWSPKLGEAQFSLTWDNETTTITDVMQFVGELVRSLLFEEGERSAKQAERAISTVSFFSINEPA